MKKQLLFAALAAVLVAGCTKDNSAQGEDTTPGREVSVTLPVEVAAQTDTPVAPMSKSATTAEATTPSEGFSVSFGEPEQGAIAAATAQTASVRGTNAADARQTPAAPVTRAPETALTNVSVLQFNASGVNVKTTNVGSLAAGAYLTPALLTGTGYTICIVANGPAGLSTSNPATLADFDAKMLHTAAVTDAAALPISGKLTGVTVVDLGDGKGVIRHLGDASAAIVLRRIHAEVTLAVDFLVTGYTLTGAQLYNVPMGATYGWNNATTKFPDNTVAANFAYTSTAAAGMSPLSTTTDGTKKIYQWFTGDNRRGEVSGLTAQTRYRALAPAYATFARVTLTNSTVSSRKIYYDIYLGSGAVTNFDVLRNHTYTVTAAIRGTADFQEALVGTDARVSGVDMPIYLTDSKATSPIVISPKSTESTTTMIWGPTASITGAQAVFDGKSNTDAIMATSPTAYPAAKHCRDIGTNYYLPSLAELMLMLIYKDAIPSADYPASGNFWSGTENSASLAWYVHFSTGTTYPSNKGLNCYVRCVREN